MRVLPTQWGAVSTVSCSPWTVRRSRSWRRGALQPEGPRSPGCPWRPAGCNPAMALASAHNESCSRCPSGRCPAPPCSQRRRHYQAGGFATGEECKQVQQHDNILGTGTQGFMCPSFKRLLLRIHVSNAAHSSSFRQHLTFNATLIQLGLCIVLISIIYNKENNQRLHLYELWTVLST